MCLILFAQNAHPDYSLVLAANRDEFYERPTLPAHRWLATPNIIAGKDLRAGGTWLGLSSKGHLAAVTNYRDLINPRTAERSRGELVLNALTTSKPNDFFSILAEKDLYDGFNLLRWNGKLMEHYSNISGERTTLADGVHGLSNALLNTPWPKLTQGKLLLDEQLSFSSTELVEGLFSILRDDAQAPEEALPSTGLPIELEKQVSPMFIETEHYGTRCSTIVLIGRNGQVHFEERSYVPQAQSRFSFKLK